MFLGGFEVNAAAKKNVTHKKIWDEVRCIPEGCVTSYGWIAHKVGLDPKKDALIVGGAMSAAWAEDKAKAKEIMLKALIEAAARGELIPFWRVIKTDGRISTGAPDEQLPLLREEGWDLKREPKKTSTRKNRK